MDAMCQLGSDAVIGVMSSPKSLLAKCLSTECEVHLQVSVIICSHNGCRNLPTTLTALVRNAQAFSAFEVVIVDSASTEDILSVGDSRQSVRALIQLGVDVRMLRSEYPGLTVARIVGVNAARARVVCFLDDDNEICDEYLSRGMAYFDDERLGVLVSRVSSQFAAPAPPSIVRRQHLLAINEALGNVQILWEPEVAWCPTLGAGLWVRKAVFLEIYGHPPKAVLPDRTGGNLISGGDIEIGIWTGRLNYRRVYAPNVRLNHHIPAGRLTTRYFLRLISGVVRSQATLIEIYQLCEAPPRWWRWWRWWRLPGFILAAVVVALTRRDSFREFAFIVGAEIAECQGSYDLTRMKNSQLV